MIRIQLFCFECKQALDVAFPAKKVPGVAEWFNTQHSADKCLEEMIGGQIEEGSGSDPESVEAPEVDGQAPGPGGAKAH